jgi:hypothetical protein
MVKVRVEVEELLAMLPLSRVRFTSVAPMPIVYVPPDAMVMFGGRLSVHSSSAVRSPLDVIFRSALVPYATVTFDPKVPPCLSSVPLMVIVDEVEPTRDPLMRVRFSSVAPEPIVYVPPDAMVMFGGRLSVHSSSAVRSPLDVIFRSALVPYATVTFDPKVPPCLSSVPLIVKVLLELAETSPVVINSVPVTVILPLSVTFRLIVTFLYVPLLILVLFQELVQSVCAATHCTKTMNMRAMRVACFHRDVVVESCILLSSENMWEKINVFLRLQPG